MRDSLKQRFGEASDKFPFEEAPLSGHEHRFETKLLFRAGKKKKSGLPVWTYGMVAACLLTLVIWKVSTEIEEQKVQAEQLSLSDMSFEMGEMEAYFIKEIDSRLADIDQTDQELQGYLKKLSNLKTQYVQLEETLAKNYGNEKVINAMIENYKLRLLVLEKLKKYIEFKNQIKNKSNETSNIS